MSGRESGWEGVAFKGFKIYPNFGCRERGREAAKTPRFLMLDFIFLIGEGIAHVPQSRDTLTRAKDANPTTLLTRFAEELRRAPKAGPDAGAGRRRGSQRGDF